MQQLADTGQTLRLVWACSPSLQHCLSDCVYHGREHPVRATMSNSALSCSLDQRAAAGPDRFGIHDKPGKVFMSFQHSKTAYLSTDISNVSRSCGQCAAAGSKRSGTKAPSQGWDCSRQVFMSLQHCITLHLSADISNVSCSWG